MSISKEEETVQERQNVYTNMFSNFAKNYSGALDRIIKMTDEYMQNQAKKRRKIHENDKVKNQVQGRGNQQWLIE